MNADLDYLYAHHAVTESRPVLLLDRLYARVDTMVMNTTTDTNLDRAFCKPCNKMMRLPEGTRIDWQQIVPRIRVNGADTFANGRIVAEFVKHDCGNFLRGATIKAKHSDKIVCNEKCQSATRPVCECSCDGENHGA